MFEPPLPIELRPRAGPASADAKGSVTPIFETFDARKVQTLSSARYKAMPILQHLHEINAAIKADTMGLWPLLLAPRVS